MGTRTELIFTIFPIVFILSFLLIFSVFIFIFVRSISQWSRNNKAPRLTVPATVVAKREHVSRRHSSSDFYRSSTSYFATFQVDSGDRMELAVAGDRYGLLVEGDRGELTFQGTRFLEFRRT